MPAGDVWGNRWLNAWGSSWRQAAVQVAPTRNPGLSPWHDLPTETSEARAERIQRMREQMGIVEVVREQDEKDAALTSAPVSRPVLSLAEARRAKALREQRERERILAVLEAMEARKRLRIKQAMALLMLAAEA